MTEENKTKNNSEEIVTGSDSVVKEVTPKKKRKRKFILCCCFCFCSLCSVCFDNTV